VDVDSNSYLGGREEERAWFFCLVVRRVDGIRCIYYSNPISRGFV
jgi:hypothetical protein